MCYSIFRLLFTSTIKPAIHRQRLSTAVVDSVKRTLPSEPTTPTLYEYNKLLREHAKMFPKRNKKQIEAIALLEVMKQNGVCPNSQSYLQLVMGMSRQRHRTPQQNARLEQWFNAFFDLEIQKSDRPMSKFKKAFHCLSYKGHPNLKAIFLKFYKWAGSNVDVEFWRYAIAGCINAKQLDDAEELFHMSREKKKADIHSYQILIESYLYFRDLKAASRIFSLILEDKLEATRHVYIKFIEFYTTEPATPEIFVTLERLWQAMLMTTDTTQIVPKDIIQRLISYYQMHGQFAFAEQLYLDVRSRHQRLDQSCLVEMNRVIIGFADRKQLRSALSLCYDMLGEGYRISHTVLYRTISACIRVGDDEAAQQMLKIMEEQQHPSTKVAQMYYNALIAKSKAEKQYEKKQNVLCT
ncbi:MAG: hypothetical protein EXX96DRAFT_550876 [Benjaminiella poitrasii]|nr:MAG: hypothetical protein EXX96DRAFT_550876 [Benjaminiella poitrasii]